MSHYKSNVRDLESNLFGVLALEKVLASGEFGDLDAESVREADSRAVTSIAALEGAVADQVEFLVKSREFSKRYDMPHGPS